MLVNHSYKPSPYRIKTIVEGPKRKVRKISVPRFYPDQIVQWAVLLQIIPILSKGMDPFTCGSIPGRGISYAARYLKRWLHNDKRGTKYCLKLDIHHFYPSIRHGRLKGMLRRKFKDQELLSLLDLIIDSTSTGLPIGNVTSQWFANFYLQGFDHYVREQLHAKYYIRQMDDMVVLGPNKRKLGKIERAIMAYLDGIGLQLSERQKFLVDSRGIDFLGYRFFHDKTILRRSLMLKATRKVKRTKKKKSWNAHNCGSVLSYIGWMKHSDSYNLYQQRIKPYVKISRLEGVVSNESIRRNNARKTISNSTRQE